MKSYVIVSGLIFILILAAHIARIFSEGSQLLTQPIFAFSSLLSIGLSFWAWQVLRKLSH